MPQKKTAWEKNGTGEEVAPGGQGREGAAAGEDGMDCKKPKLVMTRERLARYPRLGREIRWLEEHRKSLCYVTDRVRGSMTEFPYTAQTIQIGGQDPHALRRHQNQMERLLAEQRRIEGFVEGIEDGLLRAAFELRYLQGKSWVQTAHALYATPDSVRKSAQRFLDRLAEEGKDGTAP